MRRIIYVYEKVTFLISIIVKTIHSFCYIIYLFTIRIFILLMFSENDNCHSHYMILFSLLIK